MKLFNRHSDGHRRNLKTGRSFDPLVYLVIGTADLRSGADLEAVAAAAAHGGATLVQLREKGADLRRLVELARVLKTVLRPHGVPLIINDRAEAVLAADADGLHVGQDDMPVLSARMAIGRRRILGASAGDMIEAKAIDIDAVDYLGVGPVYASVSKPDAGDPIGPEGLWSLRSGLRAPVPIVGIGGITAETAAACVKAGADGVAVVSAVCSAKDPGAATRQIRGAVEAARGDRELGHL